MATNAAMASLSVPRHAIDSRPKLSSSFLPAFSSPSLTSSFSHSIPIPRTSSLCRRTLTVKAMAPPKPAGKAKKGKRPYNISKFRSFPNLIDFCCSDWYCEAGAWGWEGHSGATGWACSWFQGCQYHGLLQGIQRQDGRESRLCDSSGDHCLWCEIALQFWFSYASFSFLDFILLNVVVIWYILNVNCLWKRLVWVFSCLLGRIKVSHLSWRLHLHQFCSSRLLVISFLWIEFSFVFV